VSCARSFSSLLVLWDAGYIFARPHSFRGGWLFGPWAPYELYGTIDLIYSQRAYKEGWGFTAAQGEWGAARKGVGWRREATGGSGGEGGASVAEMSADACGRRAKMHRLHARSRLARLALRTLQWPVRLA
jgi:hypothetical protein